MKIIKAFYTLSGFFIAIPLIIFIGNLILSSQNIIMHDFYIKVGDSEAGLTSVITSCIVIGVVFLFIANYCQSSQQKKLELDKLKEETEKS